MSKYVFITGGVVSSLGKGITSASLGRLLKNRGLRVTVQKLDPYLNVDPGTMSPYQHGEVFVTDDGAETDLDIGHYERFLDDSFTKNCNYTSGKIYQSIIRKEREGAYLGGTVQVVPHVTNEIIDAMKSVERSDIDVVLVEVGGTVGDIEGLPFLEAIRQFRMERGEHETVHIHVTLLPYLEAAGEVKTKPTQHSVKELTGLGLVPDIVVCRSNKNVEMSESMKKKVAMFCSLKSERYVIHNKDADCLYSVPLMLAEQKLDEVVLEILKLKAHRAQNGQWKRMCDNFQKDYKQKTIAIVGKYTMVPDAYISVTEAIKHAGIENKIKAKIKLIDSEEIEKSSAEAQLSGVDGIVVPGGFGNRGVEGKIMAAKYARENKIPYLGLCLGMQIAVIEFARNVAGLNAANTTEINEKCPYPVIAVMEDQKEITTKGGTMRLGAYDCSIKRGTMAFEAYKQAEISERHRHRYEFNNEYKETLERAGLVFSGINPRRNLVEIIELKDHPFFVGVQFHPELKSRPNRPHPLFVKFMEKV